MAKVTFEKEENITVIDFGYDAEIIDKIIDSRIIEYDYSRRKNYFYNNNFERSFDFLEELFDIVNGLKVNNKASNSIDGGLYAVFDLLPGCDMNLLELSFKNRMKEFSHDSSMINILQCKYEMIKVLRKV